jgi:acyl carrier protein
MARGGMRLITGELGVRLFDDAWRSGRPVLVPARLDTAAWRDSADAGTLPPVLRGLFRPRARRAAPVASLPRRLVGLPAEEQAALLLEEVLGHAAVVLGHDDAASIPPDGSFKDLGFDSLTAVELRNRLNAATGLRLPAALIFDHPSPAALAERLREDLLPPEPKQQSEAAAWLTAASAEDVMAFIDNQLGRATS